MQYINNEKLGHGVRVIDLKKKESLYMFIQVRRKIFLFFGKNSSRRLSAEPPALLM